MKLLCTVCGTHYEGSHGDDPCLNCRMQHDSIHDFSNSDAHLKEQIPRVMEERKKLGMEGLVGDLEGVIINVEHDRLTVAVEEMIAVTGFMTKVSFQDAHYRYCVLGSPDSADLIFRSRKMKNNPFQPYNRFPKSQHLPNTRLETLIFGVSDIEAYVAVQKSRGVLFDGEIQKRDYYRYIQTLPLPSTGTALGVIEWKRNKGDFSDSQHQGVDLHITKPDWPHLANIKYLDHTALRVRAADRDEAILDFMRLTNYQFEFAIYVKSMNSITNVSRMPGAVFAMVFTSGIKPYLNENDSGPTEKFIHNYGTRVHHMAFHTEAIDETYQGLKDHGQGFLIELVGSPQEGLKQTFSRPLEHTLLVNEYIHRYGDFKGFFTRSNVTDLTGATYKQ